MRVGVKSLLLGHPQVKSLWLSHGIPKPQNVVCRGCVTPRLCLSQAFTSGGDRVTDPLLRARTAPDGIIVGIML